jgi:prephenate dehydratase
VKKVAIQGQQGSYHDLAAHKFFGDNIELVNCHNFKDTFAALADKKADNILVALENSLYGSLNEVYDLLIKNNFWIIGEEYLRVNFCLIGLPGTKIDEITEVHSQVFALSECEDYLDTTLSHVQRFEEDDTAGSVKLIKEWNDPRKVAIASKQAAELYGLEVLAEAIETHHENYTRFAVLSPKKEKVEKSNKSLLVLTTREDTRPGSLLHALQIFAKHDINITMLQSRPIKGKAWHYHFYIDIEVGDSNPKFDVVLQELETASWHINLLGSFVANRI